MAAAKKTRKPAAGSTPREPQRSDRSSPIKHFRWRNFRGFKDTGDLTFRPLTIIIGPNNSGKTSLLAPLLLLKQTLETPQASTGGLLGEGPLFSAGQFADLAHECVADVDVSFRLAIGLEPKPPVSGALGPLGHYPPGVLELTFTGPKGANSPSIRLKRYRVLDAYERPFLSRNLTDEGAYDVQELAPAPAMFRQPGSGPPTGKSVLGDKIPASLPDKFLFSTDALVREALQLSAGQGKVGLPAITFSPDERYYIAIVDYVGNLLASSLARTSFLGPIRAAPYRNYPISSSPPQSVGPDGRWAPEMLFRQNELGTDVNDWMRRFEFGESVRAVRVSPVSFRLLVKRPSGTEINFADLGFGASQTFPLIVQGIAARPGDTLIVEQPEIHLNPKLQSVVAELFATLIARGVHVWFETHSEHLFLRLRILLAEQKVRPDLVSVLYVERGAGNSPASSVREVPLTEKGAIPADAWPIGFFEDSLRESLALAHAQHQQTAQHAQKGK